MASYRSPYGGGDFYDGPSPLAALVGNFLDTTRSELDRKRQLKQEAEDRAQKPADQAELMRERTDANTRARPEAALRDMRTPAAFSATGSAPSPCVASAIGPRSWRPCRHGCNSPRTRN